MATLIRITYLLNQCSKRRIFGLKGNFFFIPRIIEDFLKIIEKFQENRQPAPIPAVGIGFFLAVESVNPRTACQVCQVIFDGRSILWIIGQQEHDPGSNRVDHPFPCHCKCVTKPTTSLQMENIDDPHGSQLSNCDLIFNILSKQTIAILIFLKIESFIHFPATANVSPNRQHHCKWKQNAKSGPNPSRRRRHLGRRPTCTRAHRNFKFDCAANFRFVYQMRRGSSQIMLCAPNSERTY